MNREITVKLDDKDVRVREVDFEPTFEPWAEYRLIEGGAVRLKVFATKVFIQVDDQGDPKYDAEGYPLIVARYEVKVITK